MDGFVLAHESSNESSEVRKKQATNRLERFLLLFQIHWSLSILSGIFPEGKVLWSFPEGNEQQENNSLSCCPSASSKAIINTISRKMTLFSTSKILPKSTCRYYNLLSNLICKHLK